MIDIKLIRESPDLVRNNIKKKFQDEKLKFVDDVLALDEKWRKERKKADDLRARRNQVSEEINFLMKAKKKNEANIKIIEAKKIGEDIEKSAVKEKDLGEKIRTIMMKIPNIIHESVPIGKDDSENVEVERFGKMKVFEFEVKSHAELGEDLVYLISTLLLRLQAKDFIL